MKKILFYFLPFLLMANNLMAQEVVVNMPSKDGKHETVQVSSEITFYDAGGATGDVPTGERVTMITFEPRPNEIVEITFESINLQGSTLIKLYDGLKGLNSNYDEDEDMYFYSAPSGFKKALSGTKTNETFKSESADGKISICYVGPRNASGSGWKAIVKSVARPPVVPEVAVGDILMPKTPKIYIVKDPVNFYDDGGKTGKISLNFEGSVTFVPSTVGKKIKIDFSVLKIFKTSSVGKNDVFKFYNGQTIDESNLLTTLLIEPEIVKSTAPDGSITVSLKSVTGVAADGWEAIVSEYTPGPMTLDAITTLISDTLKFAAGDSNQKMLTFNVKADNNLSPLVLQSLTIDASETTSIANLASAKVYYLGKTKEFTSSSLISNVVPSGATNLLIIGSKELLEGNNYFAIVYDIDAKSLAGEIFSAKLTNVNLSGKDYSISDSPTAKRSIENTFKAITGSHVRTLYATWQYTDTKSPYNSAYYNYEDKDCIVTFTPSTVGAVAEIDFSSFDVYYADASYGTKGVFEIYSGTTATAANILWKLDSNAKSKVGPTKKIRSIASDGSITIKFNAKATSQSYAGKGWIATVQEFVNHNMTVEGISVFQQNTSVIKPSAVNQEIIGFEVKTEGTLTASDLKEVKLNLKDSYPFISKATILYSGEVKDFSQASEFGSIDNPSVNDVSIAGSQELVEGLNYFWISYNSKDEIESGKALDASLVSLKIADEIKIPENGDPDGERLTTNSVELAAGDNGTVKLLKSMTFYDDGGVDNNYSKNFDGKITFAPARVGEVVKLKFSNFRTSASDYMYIYSGAIVDDTKLLAKVSGTSLPTDILALAEDEGMLTIHFKSTSTSSNTGWVADVSSYVLQSNVVKEVLVEEVGTSDIIRGSIKSPMLKIAINVVGDKDSIKLNELKFNIGETTKNNDITNARLYYTGTKNSFLIENQFGGDAKVPSLIFSETDGLKIDKAGVYYFWLTYDINEVANAGNKVGANLEQVKVDGVNFNLSEIVTVNKTIKNGFKGTYTVGASSTADYSTFKQAIATMNAGLEGSVIFKIEAGVYNEDINISKISGVSEKNTITITSLSGKNNDVVIKGKGYSTPPYGESAYGMFRVDSTSYVTVENISFVPTDQNYPHAVHVYNSSRYFTLRNCIVKANLVTSGYSGMNLVYLRGKDEESSNNDYATLESNTLTGGYTAFYLGGTSYVALSKEKGLVVRNNNVINACSKGIYITDEYGALVENNIITSETTAKTDYQAIDIYRNTGNLIIRNNKIVNSQRFYSKGINLRSETTGVQGLPVQIYNNAIAIVNSPNSSTAGISLTGDCSYIDFYNNSVRIAGTGGYVLSITGSNVTINNIGFKNNLLQNYTPSALYFFSRKQHYEAFALSNNAYYMVGTLFAGSSWASDFNAWVTLTGEQNSKVEQGTFFTDTDLHLRSAGNLNVALPLPTVSKDLDGNIRSTTTPTIGAYEYVPFTIETPVMAEGYSKLESSEYNKLSIAVRMNQPGKLFYILKPSSDSEPTIAELKVAQSVDLNMNEEKVMSFYNLTELTDYKAYFYMESIFGLNSAVIASSIITTPVQIFPMTATLPENWGRVEANTSVTMYPIVTGGVYPYQYTWYNAMNEVVSTDSVFTVAPQYVSSYSLRVKDANVEDKKFRTAILVNGESKIATFDDNYLTDESYWRGYDDEEQSVFYSGTYAFENMYYPELITWGGYGYANLTDTKFDPSEMLTEQFKSVTGAGVSGSKNYGISYTYMSANKIAVMNNTQGEVIPGVYLTNAAYTMHAIKNGDGFNGPFETGDWYMITFTGIQRNGAETSIDYYLADYRDSDPSKHFVLDKWKWFDLSSLGRVVEITVRASGTKHNMAGLTTPAYYCLDNLGSEDPEKPLFDMTVNGEVWDVKNIYALDCSSTTAIVSITPKAGYVLYKEGQIVTSNTFTISMVNAGIDRINFTLKSTVGTDEKDYSFAVEKYLAFDDVVVQKWNNTLIAITNSQTNGGYEFSGFRWFKNGNVVSNKHFYSVGNSKNDFLDANALYSLELTTTTGDVLHTCESNVVLTTANIIITPNPVDAGGSMTLIADVDASLLQNADLTIYNLLGVKVSTQKINEKRTSLQAPYVSGTYIVRFNSGNFHKELKIIVK